MSVAQEKAALAQGPIIASDATGLTGVARYTLSGSSESAAIPTSLRGKWLNIYTSGFDVQFGFSRAAAAPTLTANATANLGTGGTSVGASLPGSAWTSVLVPAGATFVVWIGTAGATIEFYCSEAPAA